MNHKAAANGKFGFHGGGARKPFRYFAASKRRERVDADPARGDNFKLDHS